MSAPARRSGLRTMTALLAISMSACVFDRITLPAGAPALVVHGVLNPGVSEQVVLVERALVGAVPTVRMPFDSLDPIVSDGGTPVRDARVVVRRANGDSVVLREDRTWRSDGKGAGVYRFQNFDAPVAAGPVPYFAVRPGEQYQLVVRTADGTVTGQTTVPSAVGTVAPIVPRQFWRDRDSLFLGWQPVAGAVRYAIRVESPNGPYQTFVDSLEYLAAGALTHAVAGRPRVFWPGLRQTISVSAVDRNFFDYYRSGSDEFTNRGLVEHLEGGHGVFGSVARVLERLVDVRTDQTGWPDGRWEAVGALPANLPRAFELWPESEGFGARRLTGLPIGGESDARLIVAEQSGSTMRLTVLANQTLRDTVAVVQGTLTSSTEPRFEGTSNGAAIIFRRRP